MKKKKESNFGLIVLILILSGAVLFVYYYSNNDLNSNEEPKTPVKKEEKTKYSQEEINALYDLVKSDFNSTPAYTKQDISLMENGLTYDKFSDELKIYYAIKNMPSENITSEKVDAKQELNGYKFTGKIIKEEYVSNQIKLINKELSINHKNLTLVDKLYYYDNKLKCYLIYEKKNNPTVEKINYMESESNGDEIYIYIYSAYTYTNKKTSYTRHNNLLPINITNKNIVENLDIIDKYKYTFKKDTSVDKFYLTKIEYVKQNV